jgi:hypothetical protein
MFYFKVTNVHNVDGATFWKHKHYILNTCSLYWKNCRSLNSETSDLGQQFLDISIDKKPSTFCTNNQLYLLIKIELQSHWTNW